MNAVMNPAVADDMAERVARVRAAIRAAAARGGRDADTVTLVAASKGTSRVQVDAARQCGVITFGENRVQEAVEKFSPPELAGDHRPRGEVHLIGPLQTNKVKRAVGFFDLIHSVDRLDLAEAIQREAAQRSITQAVLIQVNIGAEATKHGATPDATPVLVAAIRSLPNVSLLGLMAIPPPVDDPESARPWFSLLRQLAVSLKLTRLSMGMSSDFEVAIEEGASWIRVGSAIFGPRR